MGSYAERSYWIRGATVPLDPSQSRRLRLYESDGFATKSIVAFGKNSPAVAMHFSAAARGFAIPTALEMRFFWREDLEVPRFCFEFDLLRMGEILVWHGSRLDFGTKRKRPELIGPQTHMYFR
jgi:hypothetical protein